MRAGIRRTVTVAGLAVLAAGCGHSGGSSRTAETASPPSATTAPATATPVPSATPTPEPTFTADIAKLSSAADVKHSWHQGCPVSWTALRAISMPYWGMDGKQHQGKLIVRAAVANDVASVFHKLWNNHYPIHRMEPVDAFNGSDFDSIEADNTSAFNCRNATGSSSWSEHAYGEAIDLNPCENPYVSASGHIDHPDCVKYGDRSRRDPGLIHKGDATWRAFDAIGWGWGGTWSGARDYQHFSASGR